MGIRLPGGLERLLNDLGYQWPEVDEDKLLELGHTWSNFSGTVSQHAQQAHTHAQQVWAGNAGDSVDAFEQKWNAGQQPHANMHGVQQAATGAGVGMMAAAGIVLGLKVNTIVQLTMLAAEIIEAIATAPETFGASLLEIPVFKEVTGMIINGIINEGINALMSA
jgi:hypothetical protein